MPGTGICAFIPIILFWKRPSLRVANQIRTYEFGISFTWNCSELKIWIFLLQFHFNAWLQDNLHPLHSRCSIAQQTKDAVRVSRAM